MFSAGKHMFTIEELTFINGKHIFPIGKHKIPSAKIKSR